MIPMIQDMLKSLMAQANGTIKMQALPSSNKIIAEINNFDSKEIVLSLFVAEILSIRAFLQNFMCLNFSM